MRSVVRSLFLVAFVALCITPLAVFVLYGFNETEFLTGPFDLFSGFTTRKFISVFSERDLGEAFVQTLWISVCAAIFGTILGFIVLYHTTILFPAIRKNLYAASVFTWLAPGIIFAFPIFIMYDALLIYDTVIGFVFIYTFISLTLCVIFLYYSFNASRGSVFEILKVEGLSPNVGLWRVVWPQQRRYTLGVVFLGFSVVWNDLLFAMFLSERSVKPLSLELVSLTAGTKLDWREMAAMSGVAVFPVIFLLAVIFVAAGRRRAE